MGYPWTNIENTEAAFNAQINYMHYNFTFPDAYISPKYSGNYAIVVFRGSDPDDVSSYVLTYRILIYEASVGIEAVVSPSSNPGDRRYKQQVDFNVIPGTMVINAPMRDLSCTTIQNFSWTYKVNDLKPIFLEPLHL